MNQLAALGSVALYALDLLLLLLPGFAVTLLVARRRPLSAGRALILTIVSSAALGYLAFWVYFFSRLAGRIYSWVVILGALAPAIVLLQRDVRLRNLARSLRTPLGYVLIAGISYSSLLFLFKNPFTAGAEYANDRFFSDVRPGDNYIPLIFAERIYAHQPVRPFCCNDWLSSDRPPLQAGIFLLQRPLKPFGNVRLNYELAGIGLQCFWICGVWALLEPMRVPFHRTRQVLGFLIFSGFLFYNSVYVWPKLLAATLVLFVVSILLDIRTRQRAMTGFEAILIAMSFALALMAHPGSVFSAPGLAIFAFWNRRFWNARHVFLGAALVALFIAPWIAYQKLYDPPGNRLLKMHLAGVGPVDSRTVWQAIKDSYRSLDAKTIAAYKWANLRTLIGPHPFLIGRSEQVRVAQREYLWNALGIFNFGWLAAAVYLPRGKLHPALPHSGLFTAMAASNLFVWSLVLIGPGYTLTEHGSYADFLLLSLGLLGFLLLLPRWMMVILFAAQVLNLFAAWVYVKPALISGDQLQLISFILAIACAALISLSAWREYPLPD